MMNEVISHDGDIPFRALVRAVLSPGDAFFVNHPNIQLPEAVRRELRTHRVPGRPVVFEVAVNPALKSEVRVTWFGEGAKRTALAYYGVRHAERAYWAARGGLVALLARVLRRRSPTGDAAAPVDAAPAGSTSAVGSSPMPAATGAVSALAVPINGDGPALSPTRRAARTADRALRRLGGRLVRGTPSPVTASSAALNAYVLTQCIDRLKEFAFPRYLHVALTKKCNLKCVMCPYHSEELRRQHETDYFSVARSDRFDPALLDRLLEESGRHHAALTFGQYDEPFIYKNFADVAVKAKRAGCAVSITTNGTLLTEAYARKLCAAGVDHISFSLDAASQESYGKIRLDDFSVPIENLRCLVRVRDELGARTTIRACMVVQPDNEHEQEQFYDLMKEIGLDMVSFYVLSVYEEGAWRSRTFNFEVEQPAPGERYVCSQLYSQVMVYPDGNVSLCCGTTMYVGYRDDIPYVGNIKDAPLQQIWLSSTYNQIRAEAFRGVFGNSVCRDCTIWHNFQGRDSVNERGHRVHMNPYETFVYLK
jgi:radical SAM protein with 4Fe4S-binding SPASM domain